MTVGDKVKDAMSDSSECLEIFSDAMREFDRDFCDRMVGGNDSTIRLEIRVNKGRLLHARNNNGCDRRPKDHGSNSHD